MTNQQEKIFKTSMAELGANLPVGFKNASGEYIKNLSCKPWTMKTEKHLGTLRDKIKGGNVARYITLVLSEMLSTVGPHNFDQMQEVEKQLVISQMLSGDVFYTYMWLRKEAMGNEIGLKIHCQNCNEDFEFMADINTVEVSTVKELSDLDVEFELLSPIEIRGKEVRKFLLGPMKWSTFEIMSAAAVKNAGMAKEGVILGSVKKCDGVDGDIVLIQGELDDLVKRDLEKLVRTISNNNIGPNMSVEGVHEKCGAKFEHEIDWSYDNFFGNSSQ